MRGTNNRYHKLPQRTPDLLLQVVKKFYRGAVSHYDFIQEKKRDLLNALALAEETGDTAALDRPLSILFQEFHFYVTCWLQIELALYRLARQPGGERYRLIFEKHRPCLELHVHVRDCLEDTEACVAAQWERFGRDGSFIRRDSYWFRGKIFTVGEESFRHLHELYRDVFSG